ncbi:hypothetical protein [Pseudoxanthomonas sp. PXM02]|uniref:hypothetical protein n=1 Tax=Pseudoxanthomonas sp. PXM02 TaxID=2769294 RepID=UPI001784C202|nr:hypothetical protein [Pseudoxanthomonas sp. PXM02]MBD9477880.1 hypothetical protein [Pseudoxanthomonas sp. PXM02]
MSQNRISLNYSENSLEVIDAALAVLDTEFANLIGLTNDERRQLNKMGDKSEAFCRQAVVVFSENSSVLPRNFDLQGYLDDLKALDELRPRLMRVQRLYERMLDSEMALGSDLMAGSLEGYAVLKISGEGEGLDHLRKILSNRFRRTSRRSGEDEGSDAAE